MTFGLVASLVAFAPTARAGSVITVDTVNRGLGITGCSVEEAILAANQDASTVSYDPGAPFPATTSTRAVPQAAAPTSSS